VTETTEAASSADTEAAVSALRRRIEGQQSVSSSTVQDGLLDVWAALPDGDLRTEVERWITETLERSLYSASDIDARLQRVLAAQN
jgi:hypothetical protein